MRRDACALLLGVALVACPPRARAQLAFEGHVSLQTQSFRLLSSIRNRATEFHATASGIEATIFAPTRRLGVQLQQMSAAAAEVNAGKYAASSLTVLYGSVSRAAELGIGRRAGYSDRSDRDNDATYGFYRLGGRIVAPLSTLGFQVGLRGSLHVPIDFDRRDGATGYEAGTSVRWNSTRVPFTAALEFRSERFQVARGVQQEFSAVTLAAGWAFKRAP